MTKVCTHGRDKALAMRMLEESLHRLQTDHLDLWQIHGVCFENDPELFIRPNGAAEALEQAKQQGKVRFVGFTGHKDPRDSSEDAGHRVSVRFRADAAECFRRQFRSFETQGTAGAEPARHRGAGNEAARAARATPSSRE